tara:strand:+ start:110 stop:982 length:873 start_codon:yes stop_codon:yes gene_type:complete
MEHLSKEGIEARTKDILTNMMTLSEKGQISLHGLSKIGEFWMVKWTHVLEEFVLRYGPYPNGFTNGFIKDVSFVNPSHPEPPKAKVALDKLGGIPAGCLFKFGKSEHLNDMFHHGRIRISPASYYDDPSLNQAIRDDELSMTIEAHPSSVKITNSKGESIEPIGNVSFRIESKTNYYVHCFASNYTYREYDDFEANACIVIKNPEAVLGKIISTFEEEIPGFICYAESVRYIDPLQSKKDDVELFLSKHFKYSYQNEFRIIWIPGTEVKMLDPVFIEIGSMEEYADIIYV